MLDGVEKIHRRRVAAHSPVAKGGQRERRDTVDFVGIVQILDGALVQGDDVAAPRHIEAAGVGRGVGIVAHGNRQVSR